MREGTRPSRIIFMGTPGFAVPSLKALIEDGHEVLAVVTQPDKPKGRGQVQAASPVKEEALRHGFKVLEPQKIREEGFIDLLKGLRPDFIVVVAYGKILPEAVLSIPPLGCINLHASLLPKYRGAAPINWAIIRGERETGATVMLMDKGMDTGPALIEERVSIGEEETAGELFKRLSEAGAGLLARAINLLAGGRLTPVAQDDSRATYAPPLKKEDGRIDWSKSAKEVKDLVRGVSPWPGAYTLYKDRVLKVHAGRAVDDTAPDGEAGTIAGVTGDGFIVRCGSGLFEVTELQPENKRRMSAAEFVKGYRVREGERLI